MASKKIITGITVNEQMKKAQSILKDVIIPRGKLYQEQLNNEREKELIGQV